MVGAYCGHSNFQNLRISNSCFGFHDLGMSGSQLLLLDSQACSLHFSLLFLAMARYCGYSVRVHSEEVDVTEIDVVSGRSISDAQKHPVTIIVTQVIQAKSRLELMCTLPCEVASDVPRTTEEGLA